MFLICVNSYSVDEQSNESIPCTLTRSESKPSVKFIPICTSEVSLPAPQLESFFSDETKTKNELIKSDSRVLVQKSDCNAYARLQS